ncbi:hypothetical protein [Aquitalea sp. LB_tupeE]|uniref:hypothetical protein n=1 Tax=Aquitalea sp. LB_tupeE TaxID=2748078 RepID=UPI0015B7B68C|nr:hypothetical protein [Aquitalea sp. LB_tupeE]NWK79819.1 hypothetical protein [Aquitalea sp. LB_tupeE]
MSRKNEVLAVTSHDDPGKAVAKAVNAPDTRAAITLMEIYNKGPFSGPTPPDLEAQMGAVIDRGKAIIAGDMRLSETTLISQAQVLDGIFHLMAQRAISNIGSSLESTERYMKMAMKAQSQCRATLETLSEVKNPRVAVFANQANVTSGPQQVNNGTPSPAPARSDSAAGVNMTNELLEYQDGERLDTGTPRQAGRAHQTVETVGEKHRATHRRRQGSQ